MSDKPLKNIPASVRQRLLNRAKADNRPFNELLQYYAMERFLYRLSVSGHSEKFVLKGALMLRVWHSPEIRPTMDIDMMGITSNAEIDIVAQVRDVLSVDVEPDGLVFDANTVHSERIAEDADYEGIRVRFRGLLDTARISMQIDIGFGDAIYPQPQIAELPTMLDMSVPRVLCYSRESAIAEKMEAMIKLGELNSRMKDFYDIWLLSRRFEFDGTVLAEAVRRTFARRAVEVPDEIVAFSKGFAAEKQAQWAAFRRRLQSDAVPAEFGEVTVAVSGFLAPVVEAIQSGSEFARRWTPTGPWD